MIIKAEKGGLRQRKQKIRHDDHSSEQKIYGGPATTAIVSSNAVRDKKKEKEGLRQGKYKGFEDDERFSERAKEKGDNIVTITAVINAAVAVICFFNGQNLIVTTWHIALSIFLGMGYKWARCVYIAFAGYAAFAAYIAALSLITASGILDDMASAMRIAGCFIFAVFFVATAVVLLVDKDVKKSYKLPRKPFIT